MSNFQEDKYKFSLIQPLNLVKGNNYGKEGFKEELEEFKIELEEYKILLKDLDYDEPSYINRNKILNIAYFVIGELEIFDYLIEKKKLPVNRITKITPINRSFLEEWKCFIIAYVILLSNPIYKELQNYIKIVEASEITAIEEIKENVDINEHKGIIINKGFRSISILTYKGEVLRVKSLKSDEIGDEVIRDKIKKLKNYKLQISVLCSLVALISIITIFRFNSIDRTIIIETTSTITLEINSDDIVVNAYSKTEKGKNMIDSLKIKRLKLDESIKKIINYANDNEMIPQSGIVVKVTGNPLGYGALSETEEFIKEKELQVKFNNSGDENKVSE
ncbi:hypothetical protein [Clostridium sp.]|uniref:hypothetical protein n=1 Tax=Clostridium sp. TaxID=1506 RepID=UPI00260B11EC|nr:hypothetical protein [Clostridium sp.]